MNTTNHLDAHTIQNQLGKCHVPLGISRKSYLAGSAKIAELVRSRFIAWQSGATPAHPKRPATLLCRFINTIILK